MDTTEMVQSSMIVEDERFQVRQRMDAGTVERYAHVLRAGKTMPPIQLAKVNDVLVLVDGWHRLAAMRQVGLPDLIEAEVTTATEREAHWLAAKANLEHGLPLKSRDIREAFRKYIQARKHRDPRTGLKSYREIASELGGLKPHTTIRRWMMKDFKKIADEMGGSDSHALGGVQDVGSSTWGVSIIGWLSNVRNAFDAVTDPGQRGQIIHDAEAMVREMREAAGWEAPAF